MLVLLLHSDRGKPGYLTPLLFAKEDLKPLVAAHVCLEEKPKNETGCHSSFRDERGSWTAFRILVVWSKERETRQGQEGEFPAGNKPS